MVCQESRPILSARLFDDINRIKEVLGERGIKQTWLAEQLEKSYNMVNKNVQNRQQPRLEVLYQTSRKMNLTPKKLLNDTYVDDKK